MRPVRDWSPQRHIVTWVPIAAAIVGMIAAWPTVASVFPFPTKRQVADRFAVAEQVRVVDRIDLLKFEISMLRLKGALASLTDEEKDDIKAKLSERESLECVLHHGVGCGLR